MPPTLDFITFCYVFFCYLGQKIRILKGKIVQEMCQINFRKWNEKWEEKIHENNENFVFISKIEWNIDTKE